MGQARRVLELESGIRRARGVISSGAMPVDVFQDEQMMQLALEEARRAGRNGEVPVGAIVVVEGRVRARAANRTVTDHDPTAHAEMVALRAAASELGNYRLTGATLYVTLEPCAMCAGAMIQARIARLVYGADDPKGGAVRTFFGVLDHPGLNHRVEVCHGILSAECAAILQDFFAARRLSNLPLDAR